MSLFKKNVLLVEDDFELSGLVANYIGESFNVVQLSDPADILLYLSKNPIDIAVLDFHLDVSNGFEIHLKLKELLPELPVIFLSADQRVEGLVAYLNNPKCQFIPKPLVGDELLENLKMLS